MNRTRFNHLRADRELEGLQQVPQMPQMPQQTPLSPVRKTTYTRAELMQRGPGAAATRSKRLSTLNPGNRQTSASDAAANRRTSNMTRAHFLPRVAQMGTNNLSNNNALLNTGKQGRDARKPPKSSSYLPSTFGAKLPQQQQQHQHQQQLQQLLSGCSASSSLSNSSNDLRKIKLAKAFRLPDEQNKSFVYLCKPVKKVKELLMVRTLHNSVDNLLHESATDELSNECFNTMQLELPTLLATTAAAAAAAAESDTCSYCSSLNLPHELAELSSAASSSYRGLLETQLQDVRTREQQLQQLAEQVQREQSMEQKEQQQLTQQQLQQRSEQQSQQEHQEGEQQSMNEQQQHQKGEQQSQQQSEQQQSLKGQQQSLNEQQQSEQQHSLKGQQQQQPQQLQSSPTQQQHVSPQQPESLKEPSSKIDYVCHNIPTLQREIILLQQLGEKLEATLRANMQHAVSVVTATSSLQPRSLPQSPHDSRTSFYTPRSTLTLFGCDAARLHIQQLGWRRVQQQPPHVWQLARVLGTRCSYGCIREFRIETKTLTQLKTADETECFYLPLARDGSLQRTSFRKLRENPNVLLQQLRPLTPSRPFNLLEQDAMFFNSMMSHGVAASKLPRETGGEQQVQLALRHPPDDVARRLLLVATVNATVQCEFPPPPPAEATTNPASKSKSLASLKSRPSLSRWKCRVAAMRQPPHLVARVRQVTPLRPQHCELEPRVQTQLLKTVLVGIAQVAVFLVLIMAFSYPDIRC
ncbi:AF4/FMR2 family member lilli [Drosophila sulfurigaster albostrigata]|uniref:AF4/FMR2 family member lilli n=1 Tax=Drosophila sulfurigaster albostrigata TaxID=89887 RepID=UPI002D2187F5|nr:AF4/FMR2 family member lilli [Drosophila sulfurigaster albostrigata]